MKSLDKIKKDKRVDDAWSEAGSGDGYWVTLKSGYQNGMDPGTHAIHEWTIKDLRATMGMIGCCNCRDCQNDLCKK